MKIGIVGGRLQGTEAAYLAKEAGYEVLLIDRDLEVPASSLADEFHLIDVVDDCRGAGDLLRTVDLIIPASEDILTLSTLVRLARDLDRPVVYDPRAYAVSSSKVISNTFFKLLGIPLPGQWPGCSFPVIMKPSEQSGSAGVKKFNSERDLRKHLLKGKLTPNSTVIQEFVEGPSLSLEVIALRGQALSLQVTELEFDELYDCKRVLAGMPVEPAVEAELRRIGCQLAGALHLTGIMDLEVMVAGGIPKVLEIDARLPSQTPSAVLHSSGINMVELLAEVFIHDRLPELETRPEQIAVSKRAVVYEHITVAGDRLEITGEHALAAAGPLKCRDNLYGFDRVITDCTGESGQNWTATLITTGSDINEAKSKCQKALSRLMADHKIKIFHDLAPADSKVMAG
jgi:pyrrolysine biosynthesis protein PylC